MKARQGSGLDREEEKAAEREGEQKKEEERERGERGQEKEQDKHKAQAPRRPGNRIQALTQGGARKGTATRLCAAVRVSKLCTLTLTNPESVHAAYADHCT